MDCEQPFCQQRLAIESHHNLEYGAARSDCAVYDEPAIKGCRALRRLSARHPLSIRHTVVKAPFRRGQLRDLDLLASKATYDADRDFRDVERALTMESFTPQLTGMLRQMEVMSDRGQRPASPATPRFAGWRYGSLLGANRTLRESIPEWFSFSVQAPEHHSIRIGEHRRLHSSGFRPLAAAPLLLEPAAGRRVGCHAWLTLRLVRSAFRIDLTTLFVHSAWCPRASVIAPNERAAGNAPIARGDPPTGGRARRGLTAALGISLA